MNRLATESSPYLLQHRENPVDWYAWGDEALDAARELNRPLLVSIGYSACHWCHVMAHECFEDPEVAAQMNASFICVKVDREERPDVDAICMEACQAINGHGGWPLNVFLTPDQEPSSRAPTSRVRSARHAQLADGAERGLRGLARASTDGARAGHAHAQAIASHATLERDPQAGVSPSVISDSVQALASSFDRAHGGWGGAPKFPPHATLEFLLAAGAPEMALDTLRAMAGGGIYDQVGGGFARYAVDGTWTVPHFEKMLYDNALLARTYLHAWQISEEPRFAEVCCETLDWALREMRGEEGGFCAALDADSEGVEGKFYVWTPDELRDALGELTDEALAYFGVHPGGNFEHGASVLEARGPRPQRLAEIRRRLFDARAKRVRPRLDDNA